MQIDIKGRNVPVTDAIREHAARRLDKVARQVSDLARLEIEIFEERNPSIAEREVVEATLYLKGVTLRAHDASREMGHSLNLVVDELARQGQRHPAVAARRRAGLPVQAPPEQAPQPPWAAPPRDPVQASPRRALIAARRAP